MAPCILSSPKSPPNITPDIKTSGRASGRHKTCNKGKRRARPSTSGRWTAMHRRDVIADGFRLIRNTRLHAKASPNLEEFMRDLRLPFLAPSLLDDNMSVEKRLAKLRWTLEYGSRTVEPAAYQEPPRYLNSHGISSSLPVNGYCGPYDRHLNRKVTHFVQRVDSISYCDYLQIPSTWQPFNNVPWNDTSMFRYIPRTNSSEPERHPTMPSRRKAEIEAAKDASDSEQGWSSDEYTEHPLKCRPDETGDSRYRLYWDFLTALPSAGLGWRHQTSEAAKRRDAVRHTGRLDFNQTSVNKDIWPQVAGSEILHLPRHELREDSPSLLFANEAGLNHRFGRLIANVISTDAFPSQYHQNLQWPAGMLCPNYQSPDYSCRASPMEMGWPPELCPLLFAAQYKGNDCAEAERVLACSFHPMMILLLLYYLDTRTSAEEPLPAWMVLFGVTYDERGLSIHAHYPEVVDIPDNGSDTTQRVWGAHSDRMAWGLENFWERGITTRPYILGTLYRIQGHCRHVLERLKSWRGYQQACSRFLM